MRISVALATFKGERHLDEQLASLLCQTHLPFELQVGDDGSSDATIAILEKFAATAPFPVTITRNAKQLGYGENFIQTASRCCGEWIAFCDQDDVWFPHKLERCAEIIAREDDQLLLVVHNATVSDAQLKPIGPLDLGPFGHFPRLSLSPHYLAHGFRMVFRRKPLLDLSMTARQLGWLSYPEAHDNWISLIASLTGSIVSLPESLVYYRRHEHTTTGLRDRNPLVNHRGILRNNGLIYQSDSDSFAMFAGYLRRNADESTSSVQKLQLLECADLAALYSSILARRAVVYLGKNAIIRIGAFWSLLSSGAYGSGEGWHLSYRNAAKDFPYCLFGGP